MNFIKETTMAKNTVMLLEYIASLEETLNKIAKGYVVRTTSSRTCKGKVVLHPPSTRKLIQDIENLKIENERLREALEEIEWNCKRVAEFGLILDIIRKYGITKEALKGE